VEESIAFVKEAGARPMLVEYSPIPHTPLFEKAKKSSQLDLEKEPLYHIIPYSLPVGGVHIGRL